MSRYYYTIKVPTGRSYTRVVGGLFLVYNDCMGKRSVRLYLAYELRKREPEYPSIKERLYIDGNR